MSADCEFSVCSACGKKGIVRRKVFHYDMKCQCHSPNHFEVVYHCEGCVPVEPETTTVFSVSVLLGNIENRIEYKTADLQKLEE
jgi:hypothetical protein